MVQDKVKPAIQHCSGFQSRSPSHIASDVPRPLKSLKCSLPLEPTNNFLSAFSASDLSSKDVGFQNRGISSSDPSPCNHTDSAHPSSGSSSSRRATEAEAATTASGPSITWCEGSWAQFAKYYHRHSSSEDI